ncbi:Glycosidase [Melghirimyces algeriensis]|uniref:Alpha-amylase n=1 Tax=Melghirimyces algeriensis TaxID=910412 RepID=A0A521EGC4_9BACL|nr:Glycosidase [Melghirimyces algeriensis]
MVKYLRSQVLLWLLVSVLSVSFSGPSVQAFSNDEWETRSIYFIMTDRFSNGDPSNDDFGGFPSDKNDPRKYHGGDFQGIINRLDYIKNLGFSAIWITPVTMQRSDEAYHGYWTYDFYSVDGHLGDMNKLKELVNTAHSKGIAVMLDVVANHTGDFLPNNGMAAAPFNQYDWYHHNGDVQDWNDQWWLENGDIFGLDDLNHENPAVQEELKNWIQWLVQTTGVDGLRVDTVKHVPKWFWDDFNVAADTFTLGEVYHGDPAYVGPYTHHLDGVLDYPMYYTIRDVFGQNQSMYHIRDRFNQDRHYRNKHLNGVFIDNHDVPRFLHEASGKSGDQSGKELQLKAALGFQFTIRGIPVLYQGTEQGFNGGHDPYNREDMVFNPDHELYGYIAKLNHIRNNHPALKNGSQQEKWVDDGFYAFQRSKNGDEVVVLINNTWSNQTRTIPNLDNLPDETKLYNRMGSDHVIVRNGGIKATLKAKEVKIYTK